MINLLTSSSLRLPLVVCQSHIPRVLRPHYRRCPLVLLLLLPSDFTTEDSSQPTASVHAENSTLSSDSYRKQVEIDAITTILDILDTVHHRPDVCFGNLVFFIIIIIIIGNQKKTAPDAVGGLSVCVTGRAGRVRGHAGAVHATRAGLRSRLQVPPDPNQQVQLAARACH